MTLRCQILFLILLGFAVSATMGAAVDGGGPKIRSVQGRSVLLDVPPGYISVTLQQREGGSGRRGESSPRETPESRADSTAFS